MKKFKIQPLAKKDVITYYVNKRLKKVFSCTTVTNPIVAKDGFELIEHPPHSPELTPSDHRLFPKLNEHLSGKRFSSNYDVVCGVNQWFVEVEQSFRQEALKMLEHRWEKFIATRSTLVFPTVLRIMVAFLRRQSLRYYF